MQPNHGLMTDCRRKEGRPHIGPNRFQERMIVQQMPYESSKGKSRDSRERTTKQKVVRICAVLATQ